MNSYIFLFALAFIFTLFASIQDLKKREVANWLNFSLIAFALAFRAFYSIQSQSFEFFLLGVLGFALFTALAYAFYYGKVFAGGDAKLLMAFGVIIPFKDFSSMLQISLLFIFFLLAIGAVYSITYSFFILAKNKSKFFPLFRAEYKKNRNLITISLIFSLISIFLSSINFVFIPIAFLFLTPLLLTYTKSIEKCLLVYTHYSKLTEGDWIEHNIKLSPSITIKKTVHGISTKDLVLLKKYKKSITIKQGIPFVPAFFFTLILMVFFYLTSEFSLPSLLSFLS